MINNQNNSKAMFPMFETTQFDLSSDESFGSLCCIDWDTGESTGNCIIDVTNVCADSCDPTICGTPHSNSIDIASLINDITILSAFTSAFVVSAYFMEPIVERINIIAAQNFINGADDTFYDVFPSYQPLDYSDWENIWSDFFPVTSRQGDIDQKDYNYDSIMMNSDGNVMMDIATLQNLLNTYGIEIH